MGAIDWNSVSGNATPASAPQGAINWAAVQAPADVPAPTAPVSPLHAAIAARIANDPISQGAQAGPSFWSELAPQIGNLAAGAVRGAGSIGATLITASSKLHDLTSTPGGRILAQGDADGPASDGRPTLTSLVTGQVPLSADAQRRQDMDAALRSFGADTSSPAFQVGKTGSEIAGTAGVGPGLAAGLRAAPVIAKAGPVVNAIVDSIGSGGFAGSKGVVGTAGSLGIRAAGGATTGGASAALIDPNNAGSGATFGAVLPVVGAGVGAAYRGVRDTARVLTNPTGYAAQNIATELGDQSSAVIDALRNAPTLVPGSVPTAAQSAGGSKLVMMEKALANANPEFKARLADLENSNNAARLQAVGNVAQTPEALQAAIESRNAQTAPMRDFTVTNGNPVPVGSVNGAISSVANGPLGVRPTIGGAANAMQSAVGDMTNTVAPNTLTNMPGTATASPAMLDALRQNTNDYLSKFAPGGFAGTQEQAAMMPVKSAIIDAIDTANPGHKLTSGGWGKGIAQPGPEAPSYRDYLTAFAKQSVPINTMEVGQTLQKTLTDKALNSAGDPAATLTNYRGALARALKGSDYAIDPQAQSALEAVQSDLQRATISNSIRSPGSDTAYNNGAGSAFLKALGAKESSSALPVSVGGVTAAATGSPTAAFAAAVAAKKASGFMANRAGNAMGDLFLDPQKLADALKAVGTIKQPSNRASLARLLGSAGVAALLDTSH